MKFYMTRHHSGWAIMDKETHGVRFSGPILDCEAWLRLHAMGVIT